MLVSVSASQPSAAMPLQSALGAVQAPTAQVALRHAGAALGTMHRRSHAPQWATLDSGSTQAPPQHRCPDGQARPALHPATQRLPTQSAPAGQCSSTRHATHWRVVRSQRRGVAVPPSAGAAEQLASSRQPGVHALMVGEQY